METQLKEIKTRFKALIRGDLSVQKLEGFFARKDAKSVEIQVPMQWKNKDRNVEFNLHAWRFLGAYWAHFFNYNDFDCLKEMFELVKDWDDFVSSGQQSKFIWYDMATGVRAAHLGLFIEVIRAYDLNNEYKILIDRIAKAHKDKLSDQGFITHGNHAIHQINGLRLLCSAERDSQLDEYCENNIVSLINSAFDENFLCTENSPFYHKYNLSLISQVDMELFPNLKDWLKNVRQKASFITPWLTDINGDFYQIGDSEGKGELFYNKLCIDKFKFYDEFFTYKDLSSSGMFFLRSMPSESIEKFFSFTFHATNKSLIHAHVDQLSFLLFHRGKELLSDSGKFTYEYNDWRDYFCSDRAHNTVGLSNSIIKASDLKLNSAYLNPVDISDDMISVSGFKEIEKKITHSRRINVKPSVELLITDEVLNMTEQSTELRFHFSEEVLAIIDENTCNLYIDDKLYAKIHIQTNYSSKEVVRGITQPYIQGWISRSYNNKKSAQVLLITYPANCSFIKTTIELV